MCNVWIDHAWHQRRFLEFGKHPSRGRYNRFLVRCEHCQLETTETEWLDLLEWKVVGDGRCSLIESGRAYADGSGTVGSGAADDD